jgi:hypothetical protein
LPGNASAPGLRAERGAVFIVTQTDTVTEALAMLFNLLSGQPGLNRKSQRRPRRSWSPRLEALEDRALPSTLTVSSAADNGAAGTLRAVLAAAHNGDTIQFSNSLDGQTITLTAGQLQVNAIVTISGPGANELTISGNSASRVFEVAAGVSSTISGLTLSHGSATDGAGILNYGKLTISNDLVTGNIAQGINGGGLFGDGSGRGGGVENQSGATLNVSNCTFSGDEALAATNGNNSAPGYGGGIDNEGGTLSVVQSVLSGNLAVGGPGGALITFYGYTFAQSGGVGSGGAINSENGSLTISGSTINGNTVRGGLPGSPPPGFAGSGGLAVGGGIASANDTLLTLTSSTLCNNQAVSSFANGFATGGGMSDESGGLISDSTFMNNQATATGSTAGGGLAASGGTALQLNGCLFTGNASNGGTAEGGGMACTIGGSISNTTFIGNVAEGTTNGEAVGGGLELALFTPFSAATMSLSNCNFTQNVARAVAGTSTSDAEGGGLFVSGESIATANNCNFTGNSASAAQGIPFPGFPGFATGGGVDVDATSTFTLANTTISGNQAVGGLGASGVFGGQGGFAEGGGINADDGSSLTINNTLIAGNVARGGVGGAGGVGGSGEGGGICSTDSTLVVTNSTLAGNSAQGGQGGSGGAGGLGEGGGVFSASPSGMPASASLNNCLLTLNSALGGTGGTGASGGNGEGGGLFLGAGSSGTVTSSSIVANVANGGAAGSGGTAGQGVGGGIYSLGTLSLDAMSIVFANLASTSNDNIFG